MEKQLAPGLREGQISQLIKYDDIHLAESGGEPSAFSRELFRLKPVYKIDEVIKPGPESIPYCSGGDCNCQVSLSGSGSADQKDIAAGRDEAALIERAELHLSK